LLLNGNERARKTRKEESDAAPGLRLAAGRSPGLTESLTGRKDDGHAQLGYDLPLIFFFLKHSFAATDFPGETRKRGSKQILKPKPVGWDQPRALHLEDACLEKGEMARFFFFPTSGGEKKKKIKGCWTYRRYI